MNLVIDFANGALTMRSREEAAAHGWEDVWDLVEQTAPPGVYVLPEFAALVFKQRLAELAEAKEDR